jgi:hypothetical protein
MTPGGYRHILVAVDKFTKWIEVRAVTIVTSNEVAKFMEDITHRFSVPNKTVIDLGTTFTGSDFCISAETASSTSITPRRRTHATTARSRERTAWCFRASKTASSTTPHNTPPNGWLSYPT